MSSRKVFSVCCFLSILASIICFSVFSARTVYSEVSPHIAEDIPRPRCRWWGLCNECEMQSDSCHDCNGEPVPDCTGDGQVGVEDVSAIYSFLGYDPIGAPEVIPSSVKVNASPEHVILDINADGFISLDDVEVVQAYLAQNPAGVPLEDDCGVCGGNNEAKGCDSVCFSGTVLDDCGVCDGPGPDTFGCCPSNPADACGVCGGPGVDAEGCCPSNPADACGVCGGSGPDTFGCCPSNPADACGVCGGSGPDTFGCCPSNPADACGVCGGSGPDTFGCCPSNPADACGVCGGPGVDADGCCADSPADDCGVCGGDNSTCAGCDGVAYSGQTFDLCNVCNGTSRDFICPECAGNGCYDCNGTLIPDVTNDGQLTSDDLNALLESADIMDSTNAPVGDSVDKAYLDVDGNGVLNGWDGLLFGLYVTNNSGVVPQFDSCGVCGGSGPDAFGCCPDNPVDQCGICGGTDECILDPCDHYADIQIDDVGGFNLHHTDGNNDWSFNPFLHMTKNGLDIYYKESWGGKYMMFGCWKNPNVDALREAFRTDPSSVTTMVVEFWGDWDTNKTGSYSASVNAQAIADKYGASDGVRDANYMYQFAASGDLTGASIDSELGQIGCFICALSRAGGCFPPEVEITLEDGTKKKVEDIEAGDVLWNPVLKQGRRVVKIISGGEEPGLIEFGFEDTLLKVSQKHPVRTDKGLKTAVTLKLGDVIFDANGTKHQITHVKLLSPKEGQIVTNFFLETKADSDDEHMIVADGIITGDFELQIKLEEAQNANGK